MTTSIPLTSRLAAFTLAVGITFFVGAGLEAETFTPATDYTRSAQALSVTNSYVGAYALPTLSNVAEGHHNLVA